MVARAGVFNRRIAIDEPVADQSTSGAETVTWLQRAIVWASIQPLHGRERLLVAPTASMDVRIRTWWIPLLDEMTGKWRVRAVDIAVTALDGQPGQPYEISAPPANIDMANREVELMATVGVTQG
jgi:SPP1 family predicted phage head-tail adaptor